MIKVVDPSGWDFDRQIVTPVKVSSRGLRGNDRAALIKSAGVELVRAMDGVKIAADEEPIHVIALGALSHWGANRNGDGFDEETCRSCYPTFTKFARWYRAHKNRPPHPSYGTVKAAVYNEPMRRVELLVALNATKAAAERNGGLLADKELQKIGSGDDLPVSMACSVPHDVCSFCGNKARTRAEYCTGETCKAGGCKDNLSKLVKLGSDVHHLHVLNPSPRWFDISLVLRPADRTAYAAPAEWLQKSAADTAAAEFAELAAPLEVLCDQELSCCTSHDARQRLKLAAALHRLEEEPLARLGGEFYRAFAARPAPDLTFMGRPGSKEAAAGLAALAEHKIVLPVTAFARWLGKEAQADAAARLLPGVYARMIGDGTFAAAANRFVPAHQGDMAQRRAAFRLKEAFGLDADDVQVRCWKSLVRREPEPAPRVGYGAVKSAADAGGPAAEALARDYAAYQLAALYKMADFDDSLLLTARLSLAQNHV